MKRVNLLAWVLFTAFLTAGAQRRVHAGEQVPASPAPRTGFDVLYMAAVDATQKKNWLEASNFISDALRLLGDSEHPNKRVAQLLQQSTAHEYKKENTLYTAAELLRLKNWAAAEMAYGEAAELWGKTEAIERGVSALQAGAIEENKHLKRALEQMKQKDYNGAMASLEQARRGLGEMAFIAQKQAEAQQAQTVVQKIAQSKQFAQNGEWDNARGVLDEIEEFRARYPEIAVARTEFEKQARDARFRALFAAAQEELAQGNDDPPQAHQADDDPELKERLVKAIQTQRRALQNAGDKKKTEEF